MKGRHVAAGFVLRQLPKLPLPVQLWSVCHKAALPDTTHVAWREKHLSRRRCGLLENAQISSDPALNEAQEQC